MRKRHLSSTRIKLALLAPLALSLLTACGSQSYFSNEGSNAKQAAALNPQFPTGSNLSTSDAAPSSNPSLTPSPEDVGPSASPSPLLDLTCKDIESCKCGPNSIWICHIPPGNPAEAHTICVGIPGAINGHGVTFDGKPGGHGGDYPGQCLDEAGAPSPTPTLDSSGE